MSHYLDEDGDGVPDLAPEHVGTQVDARNRAIRTFLQGLGFDVLAALVLLLFPIFSSASGWSDFDWNLLLFLFIKTVVVSCLSYLMRLLKLSLSTTTV